MANPTSSSLPRVTNPLWVISLFLGLTEITIGVAATRTAGWIAAMFAIFSVAFPTAIASVFFVVMWKKPYVFYAPGDFSEATTVDAYVTAMTTTSRVGQMKAVETAVRSAITNNFDELSSADLSVEAKFAAVDATVESAKANLANLSVQIDLDAIDEDFKRRPPLEFYVDPDITTVADMGRRIESAIARYVPPGSYGRVWVLRHANNGQQLSGLKDISGSISEGGLLRDADVVPGSRLMAVRLKHDKSYTAL